MTSARKYTNELIEQVENGLMSWETIARECLSYMSEADVQDMSEGNEWTRLNDEDEVQS